MSASNITIKIEAPELVAALDRFTAALTAPPQLIPAPQTDLVEKPKKARGEPKAETPPPAAEPEKSKIETPPATLESLRAQASKLVAMGNEGELKELLAKHGAAKLSALDAAKYNEVAAAMTAMLAEKK